MPRTKKTCGKCGLKFIKLRFYRSKLICYKCWRKVKKVEDFASELKFLKTTRVNLKMNGFIAKQCKVYEIKETEYLRRLIWRDMEYEQQRL